VTLTPGEGRVLGFIARYVTEHGYAPTFREVSENVGSASTNTAHCFIRRLVDKGMIRKGPKGASRALAITTEGRIELGRRAYEERPE
jgi:repressor LexA